MDERSSWSSSRPNYGRCETADMVLNGCNMTKLHGRMGWGCERCELTVLERLLAEQCEETTLATPHRLCGSLWHITRATLWSSSATPQEDSAGFFKATLRFRHCPGAALCLPPDCVCTMWPSTLPQLTHALELATDGGAQQPKHDFCRGHSAHPSLWCLLLLHRTTWLVWSTGM